MVARSFSEFLKSEGCLAPAIASDEPPPLSWTARPGVTLLSHSSLLVQSERSAVLIDPVVWQAMGHAQRTFDILRTPLGAICCSHSHWDHGHFQTLLWLDKDVPILIPQVREPSVLNPPMAMRYVVWGSPTCVRSRNGCPCG